MAPQTNFTVPLAAEYTVIKVEGRKYSRNKIALDTGISRSMVARLFSGQRHPSIRTAIILANYFGITVDALLTRVLPAYR